MDGRRLLLHGTLEAMISFDPSVNLGQLVTFLGFVIGGLGVVFTLRSQVKELSTDMMDVKEELKKLADVMIVLARQDEQFKAFGRRLENLERNT